MIQPKKNLFVLIAVFALGVVGYAWAKSWTPAAGRVDRIVADGRPSRVVSLVPAATEILFALGAEDLLVGRTRWDVHPAAALSIPDVGDALHPSLEAVLALQPDLVLLYSGETNRGVATRLEALGIRTLSLRHDTLGDLDQTVRRLGALAGCPGSAEQLNRRIRAGLEEVATATRLRPRRRVYYDAWADPPITIGVDSFLDSLLMIAGGENVFRDVGGTAPRVSLEAIVHRDPDVVVVPVSPDSLTQVSSLLTRPGWGAVPAVANRRVGLVDQDLVSRLGPRVADAAWALAAALHGDVDIPVVTHPALTCQG